MIKSFSVSLGVRFGRVFYSGCETGSFFVMDNEAAPFKEVIMKEYLDQSSFDTNVTLSGVLNVETNEFYVEEICRYWSDGMEQKLDYEYPENLVITA